MAAQAYPTGVQVNGTLMSLASGLPSAGGSTLTNPNQAAGGFIGSASMSRGGSEAGNGSHQQQFASLDPGLVMDDSYWNALIDGKWGVIRFRQKPSETAIDRQLLF
jgi:hypothetical protein